MTVFLSNQLQLFIPLLQQTQDMMATSNSTGKQMLATMSLKLPENGNKACVKMTIY